MTKRPVDWGERLGRFSRTPTTEVRVRYKTMELYTGRVVSFVEFRTWVKTRHHAGSSWNPTRQRIQIRQGEVDEAIEMLETAQGLFAEDAA